MKHTIIPAIMSGGSGTRLWPVSTDHKPKQFHAFFGARSLFAETLARVCGGGEDISFGAPTILAAARHADLVRRLMAELGAAPGAIVLEPVARNTAAVAAVAAAVAAEIDPNALVLLLPADHLVSDRAAFLAAIARAAPVARDRIVTFGVNPDRPETGYGYIKRGAALAPGVFEIDSFREKPVADVARDYIAHGGYSWNAGIFLFHPKIMLEEMAPCADIRDAALEAVTKARRLGAEIHLDEAAFARAPAQPIDIAVMERTKKGAVAPCDIGWADLGAWDEVWRLSPRDSAGNSAQGAAAVLDGANNLVRADGIKVCIAGVSDLVVVATAEAVLIVPRARAQDVKLLKQLAEGL